MRKLADWRNASRPSITSSVCIHTRLPIVLPEFNDELLAWLRGTRLAPIIKVVHANHPRKLDPPVLQALAKLIDAGVPVLNQAVLLGVNDNVEVLMELCQTLVNAAGDALLFASTQSGRQRGTHRSRCHWRQDAASHGTVAPAASWLCGAALPSARFRRSKQTPLGLTFGPVPVGAIHAANGQPS